MITLNNVLGTYSEGVYLLCHLQYLFDHLLSVCAGYITFGEHHGRVMTWMKKVNDTHTHTHRERDTHTHTNASCAEPDIAN